MNVGVSRPLLLLSILGLSLGCSPRQAPEMGTSPIPQQTANDPDLQSSEVLLQELSEALGIQVTLDSSLNPFGAAELKTLRALRRLQLGGHLNPHLDGKGFNEIRIGLTSGEWIEKGQLLASIPAGLVEAEILTQFQKLKGQSSREIQVQLDESRIAERLAADLGRRLGVLVSLPQASEVTPIRTLEYLHELSKRDEIKTHIKTIGVNELRISHWSGELLDPETGNIVISVDSGLGLKELEAQLLRAEGTRSAEIRLELAIRSVSNDIPFRVIFWESDSKKIQESRRTLSDLFDLGEIRKLILEKRINVLIVGYKFENQRFDRNGLSVQIQSNSTPSEILAHLKSQAGIESGVAEEFKNSKFVPKLRLDLQKSLGVEIRYNEKTFTFTEISNALHLLRDLDISDQVGKLFRERGLNILELSDSEEKESLVQNGNLPYLIHLVLNPRGTPSQMLERIRSLSGQSGESFRDAMAGRDEFLAIVKELGTAAQVDIQNAGPKFGNSLRGAEALMALHKQERLLPILKDRQIRKIYLRPGAPRFTTDWEKFVTAFVDGDVTADEMAEVLQSAVLVP